MELGVEEFGKAMLRIKEKQLFAALNSLGITPEILYATLVYLLFILLIIFSFIFLGIQAFAIGGGFSAVINSILPACNIIS